MMCHDARRRACRPNYKNLVLKWSHTHKDFVLEPSFNLVSLGAGLKAESLSHRHCVPCAGLH